jgi:hypothetical protein
MLQNVASQILYESAEIGRLSQQAQDPQSVFTRSKGFKTLTSLTHIATFYLPATLIAVRPFTNYRGLCSGAA